MFQKLVSHNGDIERLVKKGFAVGFDIGLLIVRDIPYLNEQLQLQWGAIVAKLVDVDGKKVQQDDHQIYFAGSVPYNVDGTPVGNLAGGPHQLPLSPEITDVIVERSFSNKPTATGKYDDFFHKIETYIGFISGPAMHLHNASPYSFKTVETFPDSVFNFHDTLTSRAEIGDLSRKLSEDFVAVIGLGGTGSYRLDFLVKTPVKEIRGFDNDAYHVHNAFRSPGRLLDEGELGEKKAAVYQARYENFHKGLIIKDKFIDSSSEAELDGVTFAFVSVDKGSSRSDIFDLLIKKKIPFIDVGLGLDRTHGSMNGMARVTYYSIEDAIKVKAENLAELNDRPDDIYEENIQISELNALNAALAVVKFKQIRGFYYEDPVEYHRLFEVCDRSLVGAETK
ncbi:MAG: ThiF family adenylyltransferase [Acidobacteriota bacterium]